MKSFMKTAMILALGMTFVLATVDADAQKRRKKKVKKEKAEMTETSESFSRNYGMAGCGLGSVIMGPDGGQILAWTSNWTAYNQLFAITSGTSNCVDTPANSMASNVDRFVVGNKVTLASHMARGEGETISALSEILNCKDSQALGQALQEDFSSIYPSATVTYMEVTDSVISSILRRPGLRSNCSSLDAI